MRRSDEQCRCQCQWANSLWPNFQSALLILTFHSIRTSAEQVSDSQFSHHLPIETSMTTVLYRWARPNMYFYGGCCFFNKNNRKVFSFKPLTGIPGHIIKEVCLVLCSHTKVLTTLQGSSFSLNQCNNHWHSRTSAGYKFKMEKLSIWTSSEARKLCQFNLF